MESWMKGNPLDFPAGYRLAFRGLALVIGLRAVEKLQRCIVPHSHGPARIHKFG